MLSKKRKECRSSAVAAPKKGKKVKTFSLKRAQNDGGLGPKEAKRLRSAIRQVWHWTSHAKRLVERRCLIAGGFARCEKCAKKCPRIFVDHIQPCGEFYDVPTFVRFVERLFVSSKDLQGLCKKCHDRKTNEEKALARLGLA